jgi:hypothetical protein
MTPKQEKQIVASPLFQFLLEVYSRQIFGEKHEIKKPSPEEKAKKPNQ